MNSSNVTSDPYDSPWDIVIVAGQSNAWETDYPPTANTASDSQVMAWDTALGTAAAVPVKNDELGFAFVRQYAKDRLAHGRKVIKTRNGYGETGFSSTSISPAPAGYSSVPNGTWDRNLTADPLNRALEVVSTAQAVLAAAPAGSKIVAMLWSQGEQDRSKAQLEGQAWYQTQLDGFFGWVRSSLLLPELPIVVMSQTPEAIKGSVGGGMINQAHEGVPSRMQHTAYVYGPEGYSKANEAVHFTTPGHAIRGQLAIEALPKALLNEAIVRPGQPLDVSLRLLSTEATARWSSPVQRTTGYEVETSTDYGATWQQVALLHFMALSATFTVTAGAPVWVRVRSKNEYAVPSLWSEIAFGGGTTATPTPGPDPMAATNDYTAESLALGAVTSWADSKGGDPLSGTATAKTVDGHKYVSLDGVSNLMRDTAISGIKTIALVAKGPSGVNSGALNVGALYAHGLAAGNFKVFGGVTNYPTFARTPDQWNVWWIVMDGSNRTFTINSEDGGPGTVAPLTSLATYLSLGVQGSTYGQFDVARVLTFTTPLNALQRATVTAGLSAEYTPWLP